MEKEVELVRERVFSYLDKIEGFISEKSGHAWELSVEFARVAATVEFIGMLCFIIMAIFSFFMSFTFSKGRDIENKVFGSFGMIISVVMALVAIADRAWGIIGMFYPEAYMIKTLLGL